MVINKSLNTQNAKYAQGLSNSSGLGIKELLRRTWLLARLPRKLYMKF